MPKPSHHTPTVTDAQLRGMRRGVEKESLRTLANGHLATTPHPPALGSKLTHTHTHTNSMRLASTFSTSRWYYLLLLPSTAPAPPPAWTQYLA